LQLRHSKHNFVISQKDRFGGLFLCLQGGEQMAMQKLKKYVPTRFKAKKSVYDRDAADYAVNFIQALCHTKGTWAGKPFELIDWQEQIIRDLFGTLKPNGYRQFNTAYVEIPKKNG
jgi:phage terminase large subunit-like protein